MKSKFTPKCAGGEQIVRVMVRNESFDTIMAAIGSHPGNIPVVLEFQQCE